MNDASACAHTQNPRTDASVLGRLAVINNASHSDVGKCIQTSCKQEHGTYHTGRDSHDLCVKYHYIAAGENECKIIRNITAHVTDFVLYAKRLGVCVSHNAPPVADRPMRSL